MIENTKTKKWPFWKATDLVLMHPRKTDTEPELLKSRGKFDPRLTVGGNLIRLVDRRIHPLDLLLSDLGAQIGTRISACPLFGSAEERLCL